ncbi:MAG: hypothetical protein AB7N76_31770 [Planctomycetota bacterium]
MRTRASLGAALLALALTACASEEPAIPTKREEETPAQRQARLEGLARQARAKLEGLRPELKLGKLPPLELWTEARYGEWLDERWGQTWGEAQARLEADLWAVLGLLPPEFPERQAAKERLTADTRVFFDQVQGRLVVIGASDPRLDELVHELVHAQQRERPALLALSGRLEAAGLAAHDATWTLQALLEGEALCLQGLARGAPEKPVQLAQRTVAAMRWQRGEPPALSYLFSEPYFFGVQAIAVLHQQGEWKAVDRALADPPLASRELFTLMRAGWDGPPARDDPPRLPDLRELLGAEQVQDVQLGERVAQLVITQLSATQLVTATQGFGPDLARVYRGGPLLGETVALVWGVTFRNEAEAVRYQNLLEAARKFGRSPWPRAELLRRGRQLWLLLGVPPSRREAAVERVLAR